jgi:hypothetical protein
MLCCAVLCCVVSAAVRTRVQVRGGGDCAGCLDSQAAGCFDSRAAGCFRGSVRTRSRSGFREPASSPPQHFSLFVMTFCLLRVPSKAVRGVSSEGVDFHGAGDAYSQSQRFSLSRALSSRCFVGDSAWRQLEHSFCVVSSRRVVFCCAISAGCGALRVQKGWLCCGLSRAARSLELRISIAGGGIRLISALLAL